MPRIEINADLILGLKIGLYAGATLFALALTIGFYLFRKLFEKEKPE